MFMRKFALVLFTALLALTACNSSKSAETTTNTSSTASTPTTGIDLAGLDKSVSPGDDFFAYSNGSWLKSTEIPPDKASHGIFSILADQTRKQTVTLIQDSANAGPNASAEAKKTGDFYSSYMDEAGIESKGITPLQPKLDRIAAIKDRTELARAIGGTLRADVDPLNNTNFETENLLGVWVTQGLTDPAHSYPYLLQGGLGLPDRDYYLSSSPKMKEVRTKYQTHIRNMMKLAGLSDPEARAARVFGLEMKIAAAHATREQSAKVESAETWKREELSTKAPGIDWDVLLDAASLKDAPSFIVWHPKAVAGLSALVVKEPVDAWKDWLAFHSIEQSGAFLPKAFVDERFDFYGKTLTGTPAIRPRWQRGVDFTSAALGEVVGKLYVDHHFPPETKAKVQAMVRNIVKAFGARVDALTWMSPETKMKAKAKLATLTVGVGYPDKWQDYSGLEIVKGDALGNWQRAELFEYHRQLAKLHQPIDRGEWWMTPQTVNAVNLPLQNALNFPAAILQPPYFDAAADAAHNYGSMGAIIGHEISHSFDDQGSQFDAEGRLENWWTPADLEHFKAAGEALAKQYDAYKPFPDLSLNGHLELSENIADVAGLLSAYDAYKLSLQGKEDRVADGLTGDQRFFISYAQSWRAKTREEELRRRITTDGHAPDGYRAQTVRNLDGWYDAFSVMPGQKLYLDPKDRVRVW
jgi:predicted metalloendopeptidase